MTDITCSMCGFRFDPITNRSCAACPLQSGCQLACCPNCGYEAVDPNRSVLARAGARFLQLFKQEKQTMQPDQALSNNKTDLILQDSPQPNRRRLTELSPGSYARMIDFDPEIPNERKAQLQAYGVIPGYALWLRQQKPVTIIQVEHTELAFEFDLAREIFVEEMTVS